jgi:hypothetical protein
MRKGIAAREREQEQGGDGLAEQKEDARRRSEIDRKINDDCRKDPKGYRKAIAFVVSPPLKAGSFDTANYNYELDISYTTTGLHVSPYTISFSTVALFDTAGRIESALEKAAAYSLTRIIESTLPHLEAKHLANKLHNWHQAHPGCMWTKPEFHSVNRREVLRILKEEAEVRAPYIPSMNTNRHLARISPTLLRGQAEPVYCEEALRSYCATIWPTRSENQEKQANEVLQWILVMVKVALGDE